jgi:hypothetical protein
MVWVETRPQKAALLSSQSLSCVLTNGLLIHAETTVVSEAKLRCFFGLDENVPLTLFCGHFDNFKGVIDF